jgi:hypothetical protein
MMPRDIKLIMLSFFQDSSDGVRDPGTNVFDLSKPAAIISFEDIAGKQSPVLQRSGRLAASKLFAQKTQKIVTQGSI